MKGHSSVQLFPFRPSSSSLRRAISLPCLVRRCSNQVPSLGNDRRWSIHTSLREAAGHAPTRPRKKANLATIGAGVKAVLFDIAEEKNLYLQPLREACPNAVWYSLPQGIDLRIWKLKSPDART